MTCIGNHELDWPVAFSFFKSYDSQGECGVPQVRRRVAATVTQQDMKA